MTLDNAIVDLGNRAVDGAAEQMVSLGFSTTHSTLFTYLTSFALAVMSKGCFPFTSHLAKTLGTSCCDVVPQSRFQVLPLALVTSMSWPTLTYWSTMPSPVK